MPTPSGDNKERVLLARITGVHGLKGEVKIATFTAEPEDVAAYGPLVSADGALTVEIASLRPAGANAVVARLRGVGDRTAAEALRGVDLYVSRAVLPPADTDEGEYYHSDLVGLSAISPEGEQLGEIIAVHNFGAGDLLELRAHDTRKTQLIPFESAYAPVVDLEAGSITIVIPSYDEQ
jgi:16S rRNA processing protein RimM